MLSRTEQDFRDQLYVVNWLEYLVGRLAKEQDIGEDVALREVFLTDFYLQLSTPNSEYLDMRLIDLYDLLTTELHDKGVI
jgi:hypothetical protein